MRVDGLSMCVSPKTGKNVDFDGVGNCEYAIFSGHMKVCDWYLLDWASEISNNPKTCWASRKMFPWDYALVGKKSMHSYQL